MRAKTTVFLVLAAFPAGFAADATSTRPAKRCVPGEPCVATPSQDIVMLQMPELQAVKAHHSGRSEDFGVGSPHTNDGTKIDTALVDASTNSTDSGIVANNADTSHEAIECQTKAKWAAMTVGSCFTTKYMWFCVFLCIVILALYLQSASVSKKLAKEQGKVRALRAKVRHEKLAREEAERHSAHLKQIWQDPKDFKIALVRDIQDRKCIDIDFGTRRVNLKRPLDFLPVNRPNFPLARFRRPDDALIILGDVADLLRVFENAFVLIEGNTDTPIDGIDDWAMELAQERAELVKRTIEACGIEPYRLDAIGLPGVMGTNTHEVVLKIIRIEA